MYEVISMNFGQVWEISAYFLFNNTVTKSSPKTPHLALLIHQALHIKTLTYSIENVHLDKSTCPKLKITLGTDDR